MKWYSMINELEHICQRLAPGKSRGNCLLDFQRLSSANIPACFSSVTEKIISCAQAPIRYRDTTPQHTIHFLKPPMVWTGRVFLMLIAWADRRRERTADWIMFRRVRTKMTQPNWVTETTLIRWHNKASGSSTIIFIETHWDMNCLQLLAVAIHRLKVVR